MAMEIGEKGISPSNGSSCFKGVGHLWDRGVKKLPSKYVFPVSDRCHGTQKLGLPIIDLSDLHTPKRANVIRFLRQACQEYGIFQVINHGVSEEVIQGMTDVSRRFFDLPLEQRFKYMSADVRAPVRCGTSFNENKDRVFCWRDFLKLSCHPLSLMLPHWPTSPPDLKEKVMPFAQNIRSLFLELVGAVLETLGLEREESAGFMEEFEEGTQVMVVNFFPPCPEPELTLGMPPHSDFGFLTLLVQHGVKGLEIQHKGRWLSVDPIAGALVVNVGDHLEIFSNGKYRSVLHRVMVNPSVPRLSVASLHSLPPSATVRPAPQLINDANPRRYMDTGFNDFLNHLLTRESEASLTPLGGEIPQHRDGASDPSPSLEKTTTEATPIQVQPDRRA